MKDSRNIMVVMRKIIICLVLSCNVTLLLSQNIYNEQARDSIVVPKIMNEEVKSFQCNFVEDKMIQSLNESFISEGIIKYTPTEIVVEYIKPEQIVIKKDAKGITVNSNGKTTKANVLHKQTITFIENIFKGGIDNMTHNYDIMTTDDSTLYVVEMVAKKKSRIKSMVLYLDKSDNNAISKIVVRENKGNVITITVSERNVIM